MNKYAKLRGENRQQQDARIEAIKMRVEGELRTAGTEPNRTSAQSLAAALGAPCGHEARPAGR